MEIERTTDYAAWLADLKKRYRATQIKAAVAVNSALIEFYWGLGRDINERYGKAKIGNAFYAQLSIDLLTTIPNASGLSPQTLKYCGYFYRLYSSDMASQQLVDLKSSIGQQIVDSEKNDIQPINLQVAEDNVSRQFIGRLFQIPWGHHCVIIDKCKGDRDKAVFYVQKTVSQGWSRSVLLNMIGTDLYERERRAQANFGRTMIPADSDLARQIVKDPYIFAVQGLTEPYREKELKAAISANIEHLLLQMGKGVSFLGREYRIEVGGDEMFIDLLFYVIPLRRYLVMEIKTDKFSSADFGQLQGYVSVVNRELNLPDDNPAIGLLVCREHNRVLAQYLMEDAKTPLAVSDYELLRILPGKIESDLPTISELEEQLDKEAQ